MNKNIGPFLAFNEKWFDKHQKILIWLLNAPVIKRWFRYVMRIRKHDCPLDVVINRIEPNNFVFGGYVKDGVMYLKRDFRTHPKFAKRVYYAFKPFWWALHYWDEFFADKWMPAWSFGFLTLTKNPDPNPETTTVDGRVNRQGVDEAWGTLIAGAGNAGSTDTTTSAYTVYFQASATSNQFQNLYRGIFLFDTSSLTSAATISAAVLSLWGDGKTDGLGVTPNIDIYTSSPAANTALADADFTQIGSTSQTGAPITYASWSTTAYNDFTFSSTGRGNISKTGVSKFGARNANYDVAAVGPTWTNSQDSGFSMRHADFGGTTSDPQLVVTYTVAVTVRASLGLLLMGVG